jgi:hypothetical protein
MLALCVTDHDMAKRHAGEALRYDPDHKAARQLFNKVRWVYVLRRCAMTCH